jgi:hypothetical protein
MRMLKQSYLGVLTVLVVSQLCFTKTFKKTFHLDCVGSEGVNV